MNLFKGNQSNSKYQNMQDVKENNVTISELDDIPGVKKTLLISNEMIDSQIWLIQSDGLWQLAHSLNQEIMVTFLMSKSEMKTLSGNLQKVFEEN